MTRRPTILDVARAAGVSKSTVSLVLRRSPLVKESTRKDVRRAMEKVGYVYNRHAAGLRGTVSGLIGLVINDLRNPFFAEFAASAQMAFAARGYATVIANTDETPTIQDEVITSMIEHGVSAFVICPAYDSRPDLFDRIAQAGTPAMQVLRQIDPRTAEFPFAAPDYATGSAEAARHLLREGCTEIAFVGGLPGKPVTLERQSGFRAVLSGSPARMQDFPGRPTRAFGRATALEIARARPRIDAALCFSDLVALGMLAGFAEAGVSVGRDIRLVGFDDIEECALTYPQLSSVRCNTAEFGHDTAETLLRWIDQGIRPPPVHRSAVILQARQSSLGG